MNLTRNHILHAKRRLQEMHESGELEALPEICKKELPPEVDPKYMARADEIKEKAKASLRRYQLDENYIFINNNSHRLRSEQAREISLGNVIGYAYGLQDAIFKNDLLTMRRHEYPERYLKSFKVCRERMERFLSEEAPEKMGQMDIFDFL